MVNLCVNIDHIATLRQARMEEDPDPLAAARLAEKAGAKGITVHLREDRRHIQDRDLLSLRRTVRTKLNLEMSATQEMMAIALKVRPDQVTLVPEKRKELTTEGGLSLKGRSVLIQNVIDQLQTQGIPVSLFIDPSSTSVELSGRMGATFVELHTGAYSQAFRKRTGITKELARVVSAARLGYSLGLRVHAGHGLTYRNVGPVARIPNLEDLNIGHNIVARASLVGMEKAVREMLGMIRLAGRP